MDIPCFLKSNDPVGPFEMREAVAMAALLISSNSLGDCVDDPNGSFVAFSVLFSWRFFGFPPLKDWPIILLFANKTLQVSLLDQLFDFFLELLAVFCVVTMVTMEEAVSILSPLMGELRVETLWFRDIVSLPPDML